MTQQFDFSINQYADYTVKLSCTSSDDSKADFTDCKAAMQLRPSVTGEAVDTLTTENERLEFSDGGVLLIRFTHEATAKYEKKAYVYDVQIETSGGEIYRLVQGTITVSKGVTRDVL